MQCLRIPAVHSLWQTKYAHHFGHIYFGIFKCIFFTSRIFFPSYFHFAYDLIFFSSSFHFAYCFIPFELIQECCEHENKYAQNIKLCNVYVFPLYILYGKLNMPTTLGIYILAFSNVYSSRAESSFLLIFTSHTS